MSSTSYSVNKTSKKTKKNKKSKLTTPDSAKSHKDILNHPNNGFKFSKEPKFKTFRPETPGPGKYEINKPTIGEGAPKYSINNTEKETQIGKTIKLSKKSKMPGPTDYTINEETYEKTKFNRTVGSPFSREPKLKTKDNKVPGVGRYNVTTSVDFGKGSKNKFTISKTNRKDIVDISKTPSKGDTKALGPGYYNIQSTFGTGGTKPILRGRPTEKKKFDIPGPGKYDSEKAKMNTMRKTPSTCLGFGRRFDYFLKIKKKNVPGPGAYQVPSTFGPIPEYHRHNKKSTKE